MQCAAAATLVAAHGSFCTHSCAQARWSALPAATRTRFLGDDSTDPQHVRIDKLNLNVVSLSRADLGRLGWGFMHSVAGALRDEEDGSGLHVDTQQHLINLMGAVANLYPCLLCRAEFAKMRIAHPPRVATAREFVVWLCERHNEVNVRLGKPVVDCESAPIIGCEPN
jgi:hypothetical protein